MTTKQKIILSKIKNIIFKEAGNTDYQFFLFGSRANNTAKERSDYDIGVIGKKRISPILKMKLEEGFEDIPALIDLVDFSEVNDDFKKIAQQNIIWLKK